MFVLAIPLNIQFCVAVLIYILPRVRSNFIGIETNAMGVLYVEAVKGGLANLPCDITPPEIGDKMQILIWYKGKMPIYTFDSRGKKLELGKHWSDEGSVGTRGYFRYQDEPAKLIIESVEESDQGVYQCRVDFRRSPTRNAVVNLTVIIPPDKIKIFNERGAAVPHYVIGPYNELTSTNITCVAYGGKPTPKVTWWQENALLDDSYEYVSESSVQNVLHLDRLERKHLHAVFTCQASNNHLVAPISTSITLDMNLRPLSVKLVGANKPLSALKTYEISCQVVGSRPAPKITWWLGNTQLADVRNNVSPDGNLTTSILTFTPSSQDEERILLCKAQQPFIGNSELENGWKLNVNYIPLVTLQLGSNINAQTIKEGDDVYFECKIKSNPWVYKVSWKHNGERLFSNSSAGVIISGQSLVLQNLNKARAGNYVCIGSNQEGDGESNALQLDVKFRPICKSNQQAVYNVALRETVHVYCQVDANPVNGKFFWKFNNSDNGALMIDIPRSVVLDNGTNSTLFYSPKTEHDYGTLLCIGTNSIGRQREPCVFYINPAGKPDPLSNCSVVNQTLHSVEIECLEGFDGGLPQIFVFEVYDAHSRKLSANLTSSFPGVIINNLKSNQTLDLIIYATNRMGRSKINRIQGITLHYDLTYSSFTISSRQLKPILGILVGIASSFILVAVIIVVVIRIRGDKLSPNKKNCDISSSSTSGSSKNTSTTEPLRAECELDNGGGSSGPDEKDPDVIPHNSSEDIYREEERAFERLNSAQPMSYLRLRSLNSYDVGATYNFESPNITAAKTNNLGSLFCNGVPASCAARLLNPHHISTPYRMHNPNFLPEYISRTKENQLAADGSITSTTPLISHENNTRLLETSSIKLPAVSCATQSQVVTKF